MVLSCIDDIISCHRPVTPAIVSVPLVPGSPEPSLSRDESISSAGLVSDLSEVFPYPLRPLPYLLMHAGGAHLRNATYLSLSSLMS